MGLLSIFKRGAHAQATTHAADEPAVDVQRARTRARQRLIGAAVLVAIGVIGFPLVFETQPRPISVDIPIEIPRKDGAPPLAMPARQGKPSAPAEPAAPAGSAAVVASPRDEVITETREDASAKPPEVASASAPSKPEARAEAKPAPAPAPAAPAAAKPVAAPPAAAEAARARALLEGKSTAPTSGSRFVVQVGAFAAAAAARDTRAKVERLGLKTYTQVAETPAGPRIRVRMGPFASRDEADKALAAARGAGLAAVVLAL